PLSRAPERPLRKKKWARAHFRVTSLAFLLLSIPDVPGAAGSEAGSRASECPALPVRGVPVVPRGHPPDEARVVPRSMKPDPELAAHGLDLLLGLELFPPPPARHVDEHQ